MVNFKVTALVAGLSCAALLAGCEGAQSEKDMIMEAQYCLDKATSLTAQSCVSGISSLTSENAYAIRCAAGFLESGVTTAENLAEAFTALQEDGDTATMLSILNFNGSTGLANTTAEYCTKSGSPGLALMGAMAKSATALASSTSEFTSCSGGIASCTDAEISNLITEIEGVLTTGSAGDPDFDKAVETITAVAGSVQAVYALSCGQVGANQDICGPIDEALQAATITPEELAALTPTQLEDLGKELIAKWK
ncbi:hypothetical protein ACLVWU_03240 [Bdellovibrio sp. HCB290]|uniref:hypothetical protein n=1 Tax=Bdellovibrio sp. HCB290 TaxID=3394356 RepID=UPI0039B3A3EA